jgi:vancomycin resistance protein VanJ
LKKLNFVDKLLFVVNSIFAALLILSYFLPFIPPHISPLLAVLSLAVPFLILSNLLFFLFWFLKMKRQLLLSFLVLLIGFNHVNSLFKFPDTTTLNEQNQFSVMNYNVRLFNLYGWIDDHNIEVDIMKFIESQAPDVISFQEYHPHLNVDLSFYKFKYEKLSGNRVKYGQAIFSKYPIINSGSVEFTNTANNAIYADIVTSFDTIRVYNIHLQSLRLDTEKEEFTKDNSSRLLKRFGETFKMQETQTELFLNHKKLSPYKLVVCGDFNNTAYSYVYKKITENLKDSFNEAGHGFGRTWNFKYFPIRIDFILVDNSFKVNTFEVFNQNYSDHFPIISKMSLGQ